MPRTAVSIVIMALWFEGLGGAKSLFYGAPYTNPIAASVAASDMMMLLTGPLIATAPFLIFDKALLKSTDFSQGNLSTDNFTLPCVR